MNSWKPLTFSAKGSISDILLAAENVSGFTVFNYFQTQKNVFEKFRKFPRKTSPEIALLNKVAGYLTLTENIFLGNLWNFQNSFHKKHPECRLLQLVVTGKCFDQIIFFKKYLIRFFSFALIFNDMCSQGFNVQQMFKN